ncbi:hypothetical protein MPHL43072_08855 [Mycolicibacterium phlei DSM 43072]|uniref:Uncharacterized protein n=1 Tax=Mycolicibacterium phlei DSM 43239 = CCUG 21000 TaxID=1226750 RepID=A0A5N5UW04_MYCPH|nr:hypothetical protein MPHL21000_20720 [Mycolicibacterium phlei DSM 43239 = CCUG 21000]KXW61012.1 hypothetical protein MPHL43239_22495 [Mycolicibacterium phlei DSM 43239 = CCUG 21000]KXW63034.1 hypothetical protein MPHL43072_08855 [Mycolicibacterium phlei DSM 43072]KXW73516.1 hypothetical protein MPHL43070_12120 [Mycolicibacterium phlei DSM 43070]KXW78501.1 hypothetical protein JL15_05540 [Mycolicibacterium phlei DSM 43071]
MGDSWRTESKIGWCAINFCQFGRNILVVARVDRQEPVTARRHGRVRGGRRPERAGERELTVVVETVLLAEEQHLVLEQRGVDPFGGRRIDTGTQVDPVDPGADVGAELDDAQ